MGLPRRHIKANGIFRYIGLHVDFYRQAATAAPDNLAIDDTP